LHCVPAAHQVLLLALTWLSNGSRVQLIILAGHLRSVQHDLLRVDSTDPLSDWLQ
jgi:hypothetical protein